MDSKLKEDSKLREEVSRINEETFKGSEVAFEEDFVALEEATSLKENFAHTVVLAHTKLRTVDTRKETRAT